MDLSKLTNKVAAVVIADGKMLVFQGKDNKWGFPDVVLGEDEKVDNAIINLAKSKMGIDVVPAAEIGSIEKSDGAGVEIVMFIHANSSNLANISMPGDYVASDYVSFDQFGALDLAESEKMFLDVCADDLKKHLS